MFIKNKIFYSNKIRSEIIFIFKLLFSTKVGVQKYLLFIYIYLFIRKGYFNSIFHINKC